MGTYFPLFFNMEGKNIRVFGGGKIAARRVEILLEFGANIRVTAPDIIKELQDLAKHQERLTLDYRSFRPGELQNEEIVLAATSDRNVDVAVFEECRKKHILVNVASDQGKCDFYFPGIVRKGNITIGVTSGGENHHRVAEVTERIRNQNFSWEQDK